MADSSDSNGSFGDNGGIELIGNILSEAFILIFLIIVSVFCHHLYAKLFWQRRQRNTTRPQRHLIGGGNGINPSLLKTIHIIVFVPKESKDALECAVCLSEVSEGEKIRLLPKCNHGFHLNCIDMWFESHSTCPLCRNAVVNQNQSNPASQSTLDTMIEDNSIEGPNFPTNVLFWGNETRVEYSLDHQGKAEPSSSSSVAETSNRSDVILVIDIPRQINEEEEEQKSSVPTRFASLKRLLSVNRRVNPSSPRDLDLKQGAETKVDSSVCTEGLICKLKE